ncbi:MAG TPA: hypothetical protein VKR06_36745 [Ktedonosporobacter sp.]|nr:hypothetical protein [Ktedonosporobacter sp.]
MNHQQPFPQEGPTGRKPVPPEQKGFFQRIIHVWLRFSGPDIRHFRATIEDQERLRRSRLLSALFALIIVTLLLTAPTAFPVPTYWIPLLCLLLLSLVALLLNRRGYVTLSALLYVLAIDATLTILMVTLPTGIRNSNIPDFDLFILPTLIGGVVLPRHFVPMLALLHIGLIIALFALLPHDPLLTQEITINQKGLAYAELSDAFLIQVVGATIAWLSAWSVDLALVRASRAEEVAETRRRFNEQAQSIVEQKHRLDYGISVLKEAQARFANGDFTARVRLQDNELAPLAFSFNLLAERQSRIIQVAQKYTHLEQALQQLFEIQNTLFYGGGLKPLTVTDPLVDHLYRSLQRYDQLRQRITQGGSYLEKAQTELTQQKHLLTQLDALLAQTHTAVHDPHRSHLSSVQLLEQAQEITVQIHKHEQRCQQALKQGEQVLNT